ncbi:uncharacterized protein KGF55_001176 [Candida pseudojiufengensis]|uniref:uncharacterized protein n=1 Tax=Candida pseudojiufengensis TaxID=497109 RepID=UPI0022256F8E|nr:uncharacterized protein KGF55_001176 [Candida pseudojiufengensis]KAI5965813.1 hypothetical protein KGF55_001176 [Candida pseudojiufengensis]
MSVNYNTPHTVDVPVTDLDDPEDDIIFAEQDTNHHQGENNKYYNHDVNAFFDPLEDDESGNKPNLINKLKSLLGSSSNRKNQYEMVNTSDSSNRFQDDSNDFNELDEEAPIDLRDYRLKLLERKVRNRTLLGGFILVLIASSVFILVFTRKNPVNFTNQSTNSKGRVIFSNSTHEFYKTTIVISLDGFHPHYINIHDTPTLHNMLLQDYGSPYMIPSFPSSTFPNHWTLVTGLYPSEHGIVGNTFWDPQLKKQFINTDPKVGGLDPDFWKGGEPIWQTAKRQNVKPAVHMWPGSEVPTIGPETDYDKFNGSEVLSLKVDRVMGWLDREIETRPELILTYVPTVDEYGHKYGISGDDLTQSLTYVDDFLQLMRTELERRNLQNIVNLIVVSDHGMSPTSNDRLIYLDDLVDLNKIEHIDGWPLIGLRPKDDVKVEDVVIELNTKINQLDPKLSKNYNIYTRENIPKKFKLGGQLNDHRFNYRLAPIWIFPDVGYVITTHEQMDKMQHDYKPKGVHGYDNTHLLMRAIFLGSGPYFVENFKNKKIKPFKNTDFYNIVCDTLDLNPAENNGTIASLLFQDKLPNDWHDDLQFPNLDFEVDHIVKNNATYDQLWRLKNNPEPADVNNDPKSSLDEGQKTTIESQTLPKPSDFIPTITQSSFEAATSTTVSVKTTKAHEGFGEILGDIIDGVEEGVEAIGDILHSLIDDNF